MVKSSPTELIINEEQSKTKNKKDMDTQTLTENKNVARQSFQAFEKNDYSLLEKITDTKNFKMHFPGFSNALSFDETVKLNKEYNAAFPDATVTIDNQIAEGEFVFSRLTYNATNKGAFQGIPASNKKTTVTAMTLQRIVEGKIVEEWDEMDALGMMQQIGAIPELESSQK